MSESELQKIEASYDDRQWWQILEDEIYFRPLTYFELKGEYENLWKKEFGEDLTPEDWYLQVERIRDWHSGEAYEPTDEEVVADAAHENEVFQYWDAMDLLLAYLERPLTFEDAKKQREVSLDRLVTKKELQKEEYFFGEWVEYRTRVAAAVAEEEAGFKALFDVLCCRKTDGSEYSNDEVDPILKRYMTFNMWNLFMGMFSDEDESDSATARTIKGHAKRYPAIDFVKAEWAKHRLAYEGNKSEFARVYSRRVLNEHGVKVTDKQIREVWLKNPPVASNPDGMQATG